MENFKKEVLAMGGTIVIVDEQMQLLTSLGISQAGSNIQVWIIGDGSIVESIITKSEATWTYNYRPIWSEINWNPWRWLEQAKKIEITNDVLFELQGVRLVIETLPDQQKVGV